MSFIKINSELETIILNKNMISRIFYSYYDNTIAIYSFGEIRIKLSSRRLSNEEIDIYMTNLIKLLDDDNVKTIDFIDLYNQLFNGAKNATTRA